MPSGGRGGPGVNEGLGAAGPGSRATFLQNASSGEGARSQTVPFGPGPSPPPPGVEDATARHKARLAAGCPSPPRRWPWLAVSNVPVRALRGCATVPSSSTMPRSPPPRHDLMLSMFVGNCASAEEPRRAPGPALRCIVASEAQPE